MSQRASPSTLGVLFALGLFIACAPGAPEPRAAFSPAERAAFDEAPRTGGRPLALRLLVPGDGAVQPWAFPSLEFRWEDRFQGDAFRLRLRGDSEQILAEAVTSRRRHRFSDATWESVRRAAGEGGSVEVELVGLSMGTDARVYRGPATQVARLHFATQAEAPEGAIFYAMNGRPPGAPPGPMGYERRLLVPVVLDMDGSTRQLTVRASDGRVTIEERGASGGSPDWVPPPLDSVAKASRDFTAVPRDPFRPAYQSFFPLPEQDVLDCATVVSSSHYVAAIEGVEGTQRELFVSRQADGVIVFNTSSVFSPRFHPTKPELLLYARASNEVGLELRGTCYHSDVHVVDLSTGLDQPVPGASDPTRCEVYPDWAADGSAVVFSRSPEGTPCDGLRGKLEIARVPVEGEGAGRASVLVPSTDALGSAGYPRASPDGRWLLFTRATRGSPTVESADLWLLPAAGGEPHRVALSTDAIESWHAFSPDGRWLAFQSNRERVDHFRVYLSRFYPDGRVAPPIPLPGAGDDKVSVTIFDWDQSLWR
jgi:hypothetical protein